MWHPSMHSKSETSLDHFMIENSAIRYPLSDRGLISILAFGLHFEFFSKAKV